MLLISTSIFSSHRIHQPENRNTSYTETAPYRPRTTSELRVSQITSNAFIIQWIVSYTFLSPHQILVLLLLEYNTNHSADAGKEVVGHGPVRSAACNIEDARVSP
jgi:hypothetical protein